MRNNHDKLYNRISKLDKSKWTSLEKLNGWKHYEVINVDKKNNQIELFAVCDKEKRVLVTIDNLKNIKLWKRGWKSNFNQYNANDSTLMDKLIEGTITKGQATKEVRQIARRKAEQRLLRKTLKEKDVS
tara:strand:+ start:2133 stop:2519 length:387 start_codon:yes stop_codon:yes gene_type:complete